MVQGVASATNPANDQAKQFRQGKAHYRVCDDLKDLDSALETLLQLDHAHLKTSNRNLQIIRSAVQRLTEPDVNPLENLGALREAKYGNIAGLITRDLRLLSRDAPTTALQGEVDLRVSDKTHCGLSVHNVNYLPALIAQLHPARTVHEGQSKCSRCRPGSAGHFRSCVTVSLPASLDVNGKPIAPMNMFRGACTNCTYPNRGKACEFSDSFESRVVEGSQNMTSSPAIGSEPSESFFSESAEGLREVATFVPPARGLGNLRELHIEPNATETFRIDIPKGSDPTSNMGDFEDLIHSVEQVLTMLKRLRGQGQLLDREELTEIAWDDGWEHNRESQDTYFT